MRTRSSSNLDLHVTYSYWRTVSQIIGVDPQSVLDPDLSISFLVEESLRQTVVNEVRKLEKHLHHKPIHTTLATALTHSKLWDVRRESFQKQCYLITLVANCKKIQDHLHCSGWHFDFIDSRNPDLSVSVLQKKKPASSPVKLCAVVVDDGFDKKNSRMCT